ncbi:MAG: hypothetical protein V1861_07070 [Candidatus Micrarchaeota archaeon]
MAKRKINYESLEGLYSAARNGSGSLCKAECLLLEESIAASFAMFFSLEGKEKLDERRQYLLALFYRNCVYLSASYRLIREGMLDPAGNNMRTVFETIIWQYAYLTDDDIYSNYREMAAVDDEKLRLIKGGKWSNTKERALENLRRKYSFQKMMKSLYSKEHYEKFFYSQYWAFCQKSHSSIFGINHNTPTMGMGTTMDASAGELRGNLSAALYLCAENLICFLNSFSQLLPQERIDSTLAMINRINQSIPPSLSLAPDTKALPFLLTFREV